jgi:hypothetical protein
MPPKLSEMTKMPQKNILMTEMPRPLKNYLNDGNASLFLHRLFSPPFSPPLVLAFSLGI